MAEPIKMPFALYTQKGPGNHALDGVQIPRGKGNFGGKVQHILKYWDGLP